jgi:uncharacterized integral membrane protein
MTLSGKSDGAERYQAAVKARQEREAERAAKRPWQFPLIIGIAVVVIVGGLFASTLLGVGF